MRILLDENLDWRLGRDLPGHDVDSVVQLGWAGIENGALLTKAVEAGFALLVTMDSSAPFIRGLELVGSIRLRRTRPTKQPRTLSRMGVDL